jgi:biopolymer transport protein ExbD
MIGLHGKLRRRHRPPLDEAEMDITPMIDCTFLLLIFFLVTSHMRAQTPLKLPIAQHGKVVAEEDCVVLTVLQGNDGRAQVYRGTSRAAVDQIKGLDEAELEQAIVRYVEAQASGLKPKRQVLIKAQRGLKQREVARVERAASRAAAGTLYVAVVQTE